MSRRYDYDTEDEAPQDGSEGWMFAALVAGACAVGAVLTLVVTALARHAA